MSPRLTPEMVHALKINLIKAPCPIDQRPARKRKLKDPPAITELPEWEVDGFWFAGFGDLIEDALKIPRSTCDERPKTVLVTSDCGNMVVRTTFGSLEISSHRRFLLEQSVPILAQSPPFLIYNYPSNLELLKARGQGAPELTEEQYCQGLLASMAARVSSNTLVRINPNSLHRAGMLTGCRFKYSAPPIGATFRPIALRPFRGVSLSDFSYTPH